ncbi:hypothetical protein THAOC_15681, partial [Thalassiosira oceanica]
MDPPVCTRREQPRLGRVPHHGQRAQPPALPCPASMPPQHLHRHDERVPHKVRVHHGVENVNRAVVARARHQGVLRVESHGPEGSLVVLEGPVGRPREVEVEPDEAAVETSDDDVIPRGVNVNGRDVTAPRHETLDHGLLHQVVDPDVLLRRHEQERLPGVEAGELGLPALGLAEGLLTRRLRELVDEYRRRPRAGGHGHEVIPLAVPPRRGHGTVRPEERGGT